MGITVFILSTVKRGNAVKFIIVKFFFILKKRRDKLPIINIYYQLLSAEKFFSFHIKILDIFLSYIKSDTGQLGQCYREQVA